MKTINWTRGNPTLSAFGREIPVKNDVRNVANGRRKLHLPSDVVLTEPDDGTNPVPYMPTGFPEGSWPITAIVFHDDPNDKYLNPLFISTKARQLVEVWALDAQGGYDKPTGRFAMDSGYGLHRPDPASTSTTLGCLNILSLSDLLWISCKILAFMLTNEPVIIVVS